MRKRGRNEYLACVTGLLSGLVSIHCDAADARTPSIAIQAQPLDAALRAFALQTGLQLVYLTDLARGLSTPGCAATTAPADALTELLAGTGLAFEFLNDRTVQIRMNAGSGLRKRAQRGQATGGAGSAVAEAPGIEEVVVTARKREERQIDVPMAMTVLSGESAALRVSNSLGEAMRGLPSRIVVDDGEGLPVLHLRRVASPLGANETSYYLDELAFTAVTVPSDPDIRSWDIERVEVLRGPQGTLFGDSSMSGTVRILTRNPELNEWDATVNLQASEMWRGGWSEVYKGVVNVPLATDRLALRLAGTKESISGWIDDVATGEANVNSQDITTYRAKLLFRATDRLTFNASYWHYDGSFPRGSLTTEELPAPQFIKLGVKMKYNLTGLTATYDLGSATALYSFGHNSFTYPQSGNYILGPVFNGMDMNVTSNELRFSSRGRAAWEWTAGLYERTSHHRDSVLNVNVGTDSADAMRAQSLALFGEATYHLTGMPLSVSAGMRAARETLRGGEVLPEVVTLRRSYFGVAPRFSAVWRLGDDARFYASVAKGYRPGQFQPSLSSELAADRGIQLPAVLRSDSIWTYELGTKADVGEWLSVQAAAYHSAWDHPAIRVRLPMNDSVGLINTGGMKNQGVEATFAFAVARAWSFTLGGAYAQTEYTFNSAETGFQAGDTVGRAIRRSANASLDWHQPLFGGLTGIGRLSVQRNSPRPLYSVSQHGYLAGDTITTVAARLGVAAERWSAFLFANNLTNDHGAAAGRFVAPTPTGFETDAARLDPRAVGLELTIGLR